MDKYKVIYCSNVCTEKKYKDLFENLTQMPGQQVQKYHRTLLKGLIRNNNFEVVALSKLPLSKVFSTKRIYRKAEERFDNTNIVYLPYFNLLIVNIFLQMISTVKEIVALAKKGYKYVIIDVLNTSMNMAIIFICKVLKLRIIGIVTDLPCFIASKKSLFNKLSDYIISKCDGFVLLTEMMNEHINPNREKPYAVIEGQIDDDIMKSKVTLHSRSKNICAYTGSISVSNGIQYLTEGFLKANIPNVELHIYGDGNYKDQLKMICSENDAVKYFGNKLVEEIVEVQKNADLLINPRPTDQDFVKYSFPSKNMEYMASGTPLLTTKLPGMPKEYDEFVYFIEQETSDGIAKALKDFFNENIEVRQKKGLAAQKFVIENKKGSIQVNKVVDVIKKLEKEEA